MARAVRLRLVLAMLAMVLVLALTVILGSAFAPVAAPCPEDIETIWAIEDARAVSERPLVTALNNNGVPLAYDRETNTFYCSLGLDNDEQWPEIHLTAPGAEGVSMLFADDFTYDSCAEAVAMGNVYSLLTYTQEEYAYANLVFTGLPLLSLTAEGEITREDSPAYVEIGAYGEQAVRADARVHIRGWSSQLKKGYRVEYTRGRDGKKVALQTPGIGRTDTLLLLPMASDRSLLRDRLSWALYGEMLGGETCFAARPCAYVEMLVDGRYEGVYLLMNPFDMEEELLRMGGSHAQRDSVYRSCITFLVGEEEAVTGHPYGDSLGFRKYYEAVGSVPFKALDDFNALIEQEDDEAFCAQALAQFDIESMLRMTLLLQAGGMTDNVFNNMFIWAEWTEAGYVYHFIPWDMDMSWGMREEEIGQQYEYWLHFPQADRLLNLNPGGRLRSMLAGMWAQLRADVFNEAHIESLLTQYADELNDSGAMLRNAERWETETYASDGQDILDFANIRFALLDETIERLSAPDAPRALFLERTGWKDKSNPIEWADDDGTQEGV